MADAGAFSCGFEPGFFGADVFKPEGVCAALFGAVGIDAAGAVGEEDAVAVGVFFEEQAFAGAAEHSLEGGFGELKVFGDFGGFFRGEAYFARLAGAALSALGAFEAQSVFEPSANFLRGAHERGRK